MSKIFDTVEAILAEKIVTLKEKKFSNSKIFAFNLRELEKEQMKFKNKMKKICRTENKNMKKEKSQRNPNIIQEHK